MKQRGQSMKAEGAEDRNGKYILRLFVAGDKPNSKQARENLTQFCERYLNKRYEIEIVDVLEDFKAALENNVFVTPALIVVAPPPRTTILGNLNNTKKVLAALRLRRDES